MVLFKSLYQPGACEKEALDKELKRIIFDEEHYTEANCPFTIKPNFSTLGSIIKISPQGPIISFMFDDSIRDFLGFNARRLDEEYTRSNNPVDILYFDNIFIECNIVQVMIFRGKKSGNIHNFTTVVNPGFKFMENFRGGVQWYMMEIKDVVSSICFKMKNENGNLKSFNGQSITFRLSIKEI